MSSTGLFLSRTRFQDLIGALQARGFRCIGPQVRDGAIVYTDLDSAAQLPAGVHVEQAPGTYRVRTETTPRQFAWANGPQALKPFLFAPREVLWRARRTADGGIEFGDDMDSLRPIAIIGVRACDLAALALQDAHFLEQEYLDPHYAARRRNLLIVAVECSHPAATCFCASTGDGPHVRQGSDITLIELDDGFVARQDSERGGEVLAGLTLPAAGADQEQRARAQTDAAASAQTRGLPSRNLRDRLLASLNHPRWDDVASRCLSCGNCTSVCPTCFCHAQREVPRLDGEVTEHLREWDSCFTRGHSHLHGFTVRPDTRSRYRQWLVHKLGTWHDQYGRSGCVGCGRCIAWCPTGIDLTEEASALMATDE
jgi:sulfhydrogenase subunit beta (sulfur reductase)